MINLLNSNLCLWQNESMPHDIGDGFQPTLDIYLHSGSEVRPAVVICPGGGYVQRSEHEGKNIAIKFNQLGYHAFVVQYRVSPSKFPAALCDLSRSMRIIRKNSKEWNVKAGSLAVFGFSAGGHLAASFGVLYDHDFLKDPGSFKEFSNQPNALVLAYAVISSGEHRHVGSFQSLLGENPDPEKLELLSADKQVSKKTPPAFIWHTVEDSGVKVENAMLFAQSLRKAGVEFELHLFSKGHHGLGLALDLPSVSKWVDLCDLWLKARL
jgi:acetyl esterase/lipase